MYFTYGSDMAAVCFMWDKMAC